MMMKLKERCIIVAGKCCEVAWRYLKAVSGVTLHHEVARESVTRCIDIVARAFASKVIVWSYGGLVLGAGLIARAHL